MSQSGSLTPGGPVFHVAAHYPPSLGGLEKVVESLAMRQSGQGLDVEVLTSRADLPRGGAGSSPAAASSASSPAGRKSAPASPRVRRFRRWNVAHTPVMPGLAVALLRLPRRSLIHLHVAQAFVPEAVFAAHLLRRHRYVAHLHLDVGPSGPAGFLLRIWKPAVLGPVLRHAAKVVVFSEEQRETAAGRYRIDPQRIAVIPNGVDLKRFSAGERSLHTPPRLLFVGRLSAQKNVLFLLRALAGVSADFETTLVGDGELEGELRRAVADLGLRNVRFHGRAEGAELIELYRSADVFVLPSEREGMPLVLLEALAMSLPIVATDVPGNRDIVVDGQNGALVPLGDPSRLRQALLRVTGDPERYKCLSAHSTRLAASYSWEAIEAHLERLYDAVRNS
jgi:glycosyltransferase involved in cell wall biosynthesis